MTRLLLSMVLAIVLPAAAFPHPGGLDAKGCHHDRKRGGYHCHRAAAAPESAAPRLLDEVGDGAGTVSFSSCKAARAAGYSRMRIGEPGYSPRLDRDGDGIACE